MFRSWKPRSASTALAALAALAAVALAGCGSSGTSSSPDPGASGTSGTSGTASTTIKVGLISPGTSGVPIYVAMNKGLFAAQHLDVSTQVLSGGPSAAMAALASGSVNVVVGAATDIVQYQAQGVVNGKVFAELEDNFYDLVTSKSITSLSQLAGKTIGISAPNGGDEVYMKALLKKAGVDTSDITFVTSGTGTQRLAALQANTVSAVAVSHLDRDTSDQVGNVLVKAEDSPVQFPGSIFYATSAFTNSNAAALTGFAKALGQASDWVRSNKAAAVPICVKGTQATDAECKGAIALATNPNFAGKYTWSSTSAVNVKGIQSAIKVVAEFVTPKASSLTTADMVDTAIVQ